MSQAIPVAQLKSITMSIYRYDPSLDDKPYMQDIVIEVPKSLHYPIEDHVAKAFVVQME